MDRGRVAQVLLVLAARSLELVHGCALLTLALDGAAIGDRLEVEEVVRPDAVDVVRARLGLVLEHDGGDVN